MSGSQITEKRTPVYVQNLTRRHGMLLLKITCFGFVVADHTCDTGYDSMTAVGCRTTPSVI